MAIRLLNWNIRQGGAKCLPEILEAVASHKPDLAVITEFRRNASGERISARLSDLGLIQQTAPEVPPTVNTVLIASRFEVRDAAAIIPPDLRRHVQVLRVLDMTVAGAFCATKETGKSFLRFLCDDGNGFQNGAALATGDFNFGPQGKKIGLYSQLTPLFEAGWVDVWKRDRPGEVAWCHQKPAGGGKSQPDHLFVTPELAPRAVFADYSMRELDAGLSDHAPMIAELRAGAPTFPVRRQVITPDTKFTCDAAVVRRG